MNTLDVVVHKVLSEPSKRIDDEFCCWEVTVMAGSGYSPDQKEIVRKCTKTEIEKIKPGYLLRRE